VVTQSKGKQHLLTVHAPTRRRTLGDRAPDAPGRLANHGRPPVRPSVATFNH